MPPEAEDPPGMASSSDKENKSDRVSAVASDNMDSMSSRERKRKVVDIMGRRKKAGRTKVMILFLHPHPPLDCSKAFVQTYSCVFLALCRLYIVLRHSQPFLDLKEIVYHAFFYRKVLWSRPLFFLFWRHPQPSTNL